jgi:hypothetical protein
MGRRCEHRRGGCHAHRMTRRRCETTDASSDSAVRAVDAVARRGRAVGVGARDVVVTARALACWVHSRERGGAAPKGEWRQPAQCRG